MIRFLQLLIVLVVCDARAQFQATVENVKSGKKEVYAVRSDETQYRYDISQDGQQIIVIAKPQLNKTLILLTEKKYFVRLACDDMMSLMNDPVQSYAISKKRYGEQAAGNENINGYACEKKELLYNNKPYLTVWYSKDLNFPLKIINNLKSDSYMIVKNISKWTPDPVLFEVPDGYTEVDDQLRPIIPEPPPPGKWTIKTIRPPYQGEVSRGTELVFTVEKEVYHKVIPENKTDKPAKIIRFEYMKGEPLPEDLQGPVDYRSLRLYPGERKPLTFGWDTGTEIHIKVYEGTMWLDIHEEAR